MQQSVVIDKSAMVIGKKSQCRNNHNLRLYSPHNTGRERGTLQLVSSAVLTVLSHLHTVPEGDECSKHTILANTDRSASFYDRSVTNCDSKLAGWYRFRGAAGQQLSEQCLPKWHCGSHSTGWLNGTHPTVGDGVVERRVCFNWKDSCCKFKTNIRVRNCGAFYVYKLKPVPACNLRYCSVETKQSE